MSLGDLVTGIGVFNTSDPWDGRQAIGGNALDGGQALHVRVPRADDTLFKVSALALTKYC
ncbi:MAG TPA: hypothetical protein QGI07_00895 [Dehalococcoidia bacterium]|nr:hypothetical protein [Chloroflexota bacterium]MDP5876451.1 hypothetical protein [Dehalococcoidia bacterium]MDP6274124.1 hypothetical protein [Dehalococcoidia bacterium]MDP7160328.1 hypothetical protein [Dehalococcoidia bacterium]MDP7213525.1 hypothetical protein [Dehalococcoidia bacterium]